MECAALQVRHLDPPQQSQIRPPQQSKLRDRFRHRCLVVAHLLRPRILIHRSNRRTVLRDHLPHSKSIDQFHIRQVREDFADRPLFRRWLEVEDFLRQLADGHRDLLWFSFRRVECFLQFLLGHNRSSDAPPWIPLLDRGRKIYSRQIPFKLTLSFHSAISTFHFNCVVIACFSCAAESGSPCTRYVICGAALKLCNHSSNSGVSAWSLNCSSAATCARIGTSSPKIFTS